MSTIRRSWAAMSNMIRSLTSKSGMFNDLFLTSEGVLNQGGTTDGVGCWRCLGAVRSEVRGCWHFDPPPGVSEFLYYCICFHSTKLCVRV